MFQRLQGVRSDYDATKLLSITKQNQMHKKRLAGFENGRAKKDPLFESHQLQETISRKKLSTLQTFSRVNVGRDQSIDSSLEKSEMMH